MKLFLGVGVTDFTAEVSNVALDASEKDSDFVSYAEANSGGARDYVLSLTIRMDTAAASLWYYVWSVAGTDVTYQFWPNGQNTVDPTTPTETYPKFSGTLTISEPDGDLLGAEGNKSTTAVGTVAVKWQCTAKPTLDVA